MALRDRKKKLTNNGVSKGLFRLSASDNCDSRNGNIIGDGLYRIRVDW